MVPFNISIFAKPPTTDVAPLTCHTPLSRSEHSYSTMSSSAVEMPLVEALVDSARNATSTLLSFLGWEDVVGLAISSTPLFVQVKAIIQGQSDDISCGSSPYPIPCDSAHRSLHGMQQAAPGGSSKSSQCLKWSLGGPVPPSFVYLNEAIHAFEDSGADELEGCACFGVCGVDDTLCPCVQLNVAVQRCAPLVRS